MGNNIPRRIILGVTGSISAYKSPEIVRLLVKGGFEVRCAMTANAARFTTPLTLATLARSPVFQNLEDPALWEMAHLSLADWAGIFLIAPATADFIARLAAGLAENLLDSLALAFHGKIVVCPAMDGDMWSHPATQANVRRLLEFGYDVWGPEVGELASGKIGVGRMIEPKDIVKRLECFFLSPKITGSKNAK
jgi:phosphopantothenoylcysteine decarboxylase/phosphopantothenate--cysteine ligase